MGHGMLSSRFKRFEVNITGKERGPASLSGALSCTQRRTSLGECGHPCIGTYTTSTPAKGRAGSTTSTETERRRRHWKAEVGLTLKSSCRART